MKPRYSEVFENYAKIAEDKGLIVKEASETKVAAQNISTIEALYGVKPDSNQKDILDQAHPEPVVVSPAHDKVNGLVENLKERQNIMVGIARKPTNGLLTQHIYAEASADLVNELVKVAFVLDMKNDTELMKLADNCAENLEKRAVAWLAAIPVILKAIGWGAAAAATYSVVSNTLNLSQGVMIDASNALTEMQDAVEDFPVLATEMSEAMEDIRSILTHTKQVSDIRMALAKLLAKSNKDPSSALKLIENKSDEQIIEFLNGYKDECLYFINAVPSYKKILNEVEATDNSYSPEWTESIRTLFRSVVKSDVQDVVQALDRMVKSLSEQAGSIDGEVQALRDLRQKSDVAKEEVAKTKGRADLRMPELPEE